MVERVRLSEVSAQATAALVALDATALARLAARLEESAGSRPEVEPEAAEWVSISLRVFQEVLAATRQNIQVLQRLQDRKVRAEWAR